MVCHIIYHFPELGESGVVRVTTDPVCIEFQDRAFVKTERTRFHQIETLIAEKRIDLPKYRLFKI